MRLLLLVFLLLATPAMAQQQPSYTTLDETLVRQARSCEQIAGQQIAELQKRLTDKDKQITALTKERDDLKAPNP